MPVSFEILVPGVHRLLPNQKALAFRITTSSPPKSHRGPKPLWQRRFSQAGGTLIHIGDPWCRVGKGPFWSFEIFKLEKGWKRVRFKQKYLPSFRRLLASMLLASEPGFVLIGTDDQFGPKPQVYRRIYSIDTYLKMHARFGIRLNSLAKVVS